MNAQQSIATSFGHLRHDLCAKCVLSRRCLNTLLDSLEEVGRGAEVANASLKQFWKPEQLICSGTVLSGDSLFKIFGEAMHVTFGDGRPRRRNNCWRRRRLSRRQRALLAATRTGETQKCASYQGQSPIHAIPRSLRAVFVSRLGGCC